MERNLSAKAGKCGSHSIGIIICREKIILTSIKVGANEVMSKWDLVCVLVQAALTKLILGVLTETYISSK